jgi:mono/diheme cytochrome c family protein
VNPPFFLARVLAALLPVVFLAGCDNMQHQDNVRPFDASTHFADGASAQHPPAHTVARGAPAADDPIATGRNAGGLLTEFPVPLTRDFLQRGRERFNGFCAPCHGEDGYGRGIVVRRGFPAPASFYDPASRAAAVGRLYEVITRGSGRMFPLADRIEPRDRWAIVAYVRALQRSQHATPDDLPAEEHQRLSAQ